MAATPTREGFRTVTPYLIVRGAAELIDFLKQAFGATETLRTPTPGGRIHAEVKLGDSMVMMGDASPEWEPMPGSIYLYLADTDAVYQRALQAGATTLMAPADQDYGDRMAGVKDPFGNVWWIATHKGDT